MSTAAKHASLPCTPKDTRISLPKFAFKHSSLSAQMSSSDLRNRFPFWQPHAFQRGHALCSEPAEFPPYETLPAKQFHVLIYTFRLLPGFLIKKVKQMFPGISSRTMTSIGNPITKCIKISYLEMAQYEIYINTDMYMHIYLYTRCITYMCVAVSKLTH